MLTVADVVPTAEVGQYWASTFPLYLFRIGDADIAQMQFTLLTLVIGGSPAEPRYCLGYEVFRGCRRLDNSTVIEPDMLSIEGPLRTGDVLTLNGVLAFVVVKGSTVTLYSDWSISKDPNILPKFSLYQRGPIDPNLEPLTRFERVLR
jgi:hypothetical protein